MTVSADDFNCASCTKRFETGNPRAPLQCRALPPVQGLARDAVFPTVAADHHCHVYFQADPGAAKARREAAKATADLDGKVAATQARAEAGSAAPAAAQPELELGGDPQTRARRARAPAKA